LEECGHEVLVANARKLRLIYANSRKTEEVDAENLEMSRSVGAYLGLVPARDQSGDRDPQKRISKEGEEMLRKLLVGSAPYVLGPFGSDSDLRRHAQKIASRGGKNAKMRAAVAVARKLSLCSCIGCG